MAFISPLIFSSMAATRLLIEAEASPAVYVIVSQGQAQTGFIIEPAKSILTIR